MLPNAVTLNTVNKGIITLYPLFIDRTTGNHINIRCVLNNCFWNDSAGANFQKTGVLVPGDVELYIPYPKEATGREYIEPQYWYELPHDEANTLYWTLDLRQVNNRPIIYKGDSLHEFVWQHPSSSAMVQPPTIARQEVTFLANNPNARRAQSVDEQIFGTVASPRRDKRHILVK